MPRAEMLTVSSRVRTYQSAQMLTSLALLPVMAGLFGLVLRMQSWGSISLAIGVGALVALDVLLVVVGAASWRLGRALGAPCQDLCRRPQ